MAASYRMKLGKFVEDQDGTLHGKISGLGMNTVSVVSEPTVDLSGNTYLKLIADPLGDAYEVGAAFPKVKDGMSYYAVNLDSPALPATIHGALFRDRKVPHSLNLIWNRPDQSGQSNNAMPRAGQPQGNRFTGGSITP